MPNGLMAMPPPIDSEIRSAPVESAASQAVIMLHRTRDLPVRERAMPICSLRSQR
jgi:hypothetical protein